MSKRPDAIKPAAKPKPDAVRKPGAPAPQPKDPRTQAPRIMAMSRPGRISTPVKTDVSALSKPDVFNHWKAGVHAAGDIGENVITIYDVIGEDFWTGGGVTVNRIDAALRKIGNKDIEVHVNSPGGDVFEGIGIYNRLREHPGKITMKVMGLAASAASILAMAGDEILIGPASFLMIHNCWIVCVGNRHDMAETSVWLQPFDGAMAEVYAARSGKPLKDVAAWMDAETYMSGSVAIERGFADGLLSADDMKEDEGATASARDMTAIRQAEHGLIAAGSSRAAARELLSKIKGKPDAAPMPAKPDAGDLSWMGLAADLTANLRI